MANILQKLYQLIPQYESEGQHELALQLCKETLHDLKEEKENDNSDVAKVMNVLEQVYLNQISYNKFKFEPNNHRVAVTLTELGYFYCEWKKFGDAQSVYHRALVIMEKIYKENDPEIEKVLWKLASTCRHQEKYDEAELYLKDSLKICETFGQLEVAKRSLDLGNLYMQKGDLKAAEQTYNEALKIFTNKLRPRDLLVSHTKYNLAKCFAKQEKFKEAEVSFRAASIIYQSKEEDLRLANAHLGLGCCFLEQCKFKESKEYLQSALSLLTKPPQDQKDLKVADIHFNLGVCFSGQKQNEEAESAYSHAVDIYTEKLGGNNRRLAEPIFEMANCLMARGQHKKAEEYLIKVLTLHEENPLIGKLKSEDTKYCLVICLMKQGRYHDANEQLKEASFFGQETLNLATIKFNLGNCFLDAKNYQESVELYEEALSILEKQKGNDLMVADIKYNLALGLTQLNEIEEAEEFYLGSLSVYTKELKPNDPHLCNVKMNLGNCYLTLEEWKNAQKYFSMVLEINKSGRGINSSDVAEAKKNLGLCLYNQKCLKEALCNFEEAKILFDKYSTNYTSYFDINSLRNEEIITDFLEKKSSWWFKQERVKYFLTDFFPPYSLKSAKNKTILGDVYLHNGKITAAVKCYKECVKFYKSLPVDVDPDVANALKYLEESIKRQGKCLREQGKCVREQGRYKDAEESFREALEIYEKHFKDTDELIIADIKCNIACCLSEQGNRIGAVEYYESAFANYEKRPICLVYARTKFIIGYEYNEVKKWDIAEKWYRESLELYRSLPGDMNQYVAKVLRFLCKCLNQQGKYKEAEESYREALKIYEKQVKVTDELKIADILFNIAKCLSNQGNRIGAVEYYKSACAHYEKRPICLDFAHSKYNIGDEYRLLKKWDMAEKWYRESLKLYRSIPGDRDQDVAKVLRFLGECLNQQGKHKDAEESFRESLDIYEKHVKDTDELTIAEIKFNIGYCLSKQGNRIGAVEYYKSACANYEKRPICLDFATAKYNIGKEYSELDKWDLAEKWFRESLKLYRSLPGDRNQDVAKALRYIGKCLRYQGKYIDAEESYREALEINEKHVTDTDELIIADIKFNIAYCLSEQGYRIGAVEYYESAFANYEKRPICLLFAHAKFNIGEEYRLLGKWDMAEKWYRESLELYRSLPGNRNEDVARALRFLGHCLKDQGKYKEAEESSREALEIYEKHVQDTDELIIADIKFNIAWCLSEQGNRIGAVEYYESACANYEKEPICLQFAHAKKNIGNEYFNLEKWDMAEMWYRESLELYRSLPGDLNQDIAKVLRFLGICLRVQGKYKDAEESSRESFKGY